MIRRPLTRVLALLLILTGPATLSAEALRLPSIISDHMVLQRDQPVALWGWATPESDVAISFKGQTVLARANTSGKWRVNLQPLPADANPATLTITSGDQTLTVNDILVGEVWLCSGQSNMEWTVSNSNNPEEEIAAADWPQIRHIKAPHRPAMQPQDDIDTAWEVCSPDTAGRFTAVGYYFARTLHQELNVPVGLVNSTWGGTLIEPWIPLSGYENTPALSELYEEIATKQPDSPQYKTLAKNYLAEMKTWVDLSHIRTRSGQPLYEPPAFPEPIKPYTNHQSPTMLFNGMLNPFIPFTLRGSIWYQGESNHFGADRYPDLTRALLAGWREHWEQPDLPYYYVQIAPFHYNNENPHVIPRFWEAQAQIEKQLPHTGMVVIHDVGDPNDIHPRNKQDVGLRLAHMALKRTYSRDAFVDSGPRYESMRTEGNQLIITFTHTAEGLTTPGNVPLNAFEIAGEAQPWTQAIAKITGPDTVAVTADGIDTPVAVRFAWHKLAAPNLINSAGLPTAPFRAGEPPKLDFLTLNVPDSHDYQVIYEADLNNLGKEITYKTNHAADFTGEFDRIAYFLQLADDPGTEGRWVYVSMDAFTDDLTKIAIPTLDADAIFQQTVHNLRVRSNAYGVPYADNLNGHIEFWPNNYGKSNAANVPGATNAAYDTGDQISTNTPDGYGCMQVHLTNPAVTLFAINNWKNTPFDLGIGTNTQDGEPDWTFTKTSEYHPIKRLIILVRPAPTP